MRKMLATPFRVAGRGRLTISPAVAVLLTLSVLVLPAADPQPAAAAAKGIVDWRLENRYDMAMLPGLVAELGPDRLDAAWTRVSVSWNRLQPVAPGTSLSSDTDGDGYADSYVAQLDTVITALHDAGHQVIVTGWCVPEWASDRRYWTSAGYDHSAAMRIDDPEVRSAFAAFAAFLAERYAGKVSHFEVWNEPNLWSGIHPQRVGKKEVAPRVYLKMLKAFRDGVERGAPVAVVIAGATSPRGANDARSTSPQRFAQYLKSHRAARWFDAYSHHPYTPKGSRNAAPNRLPNNPRNCVTLGNLGVLLKVFPKRDFYLTEFGYGTQESAWCGLEVSRAHQARYLRQAYARVARWRRVKVLLWYSVVDYVPNPADPTHAVYLGLVERDGVTRKPSWYAFAGGNALSLSVPASVPARSPFAVTGTLTSKLGGVEGATVILQARSLSGGSWSRRASASTQVGGAFSFTVRQRLSSAYRVVWDGVCTSVPRRVRSL